MNYRGFTAYLERMLGVGSRNVGSILLLVFGTMAMGVMGSALFGILTIVIGESGWALLILLIVSLLLLVFAAVGLSAVIGRLRFGKSVHVKEEAEFLPHRGLVLLVSTGPHSSNDPALQRHVRAKGDNRLEYCWLIYTDESETVAHGLEGKYQPRVKDVRLRRLVGAYSLGSSFYILRSVIDEALAEGLNLDDLIVDVTGGTKMMTAGATLACAERKVAIQYMRAQYDASGRRVADVELIPMKVLLSEIFGEAEKEPIVEGSALVSEGDAPRESDD